MRQEEEDTTYTAVRKTGATSEQKQKPRRVQPRRRERDLGATPSGIGQKTCGKPEGRSYVATERVRRTRVRRGIARAEAWLGTWRHVDSRTSTVVQVRGVSTTEEREGREDDGVGLPRRALRAVAVPRGVL